MADRRALRHAATKREILDAAWSLSSERGLTGWSLRDLADQVGMRAPSLYGYYAGKNELFDALFRDGYEQLKQVVQGTRRPRGRRALLRVAARTFLDFCVSDPPRYQLLFLRTIPGFEPSHDSYAVAVEVLDATRGVLASAGASGEDDLDLWTALVTGLASQQMSNDPGGARWLRLSDAAMDMYAAARIDSRRTRS
ncbi:MAG TPA: TetR/AcrR family transcriptional regulator [Candidatus Nanopelagicales bacterium]|nr:TetR/AcrR family transcriptional regulator [Candidatus Nanopelagicales bacterium]